MEEIIEWVKANPYVLYIAGIMLLYLVIGVPYMVIKSKKAKANRIKFEEENPDTAKVYIKTNWGGVTSENMFIHGVNDDLPNNFSEGSKRGFFLKPGTHVVELEYSWTRPGVMYKTVTKNTGKSKIEVEAEANKKYWIYYDRDKETYIFEEVEEKEMAKL